MKIIGRELEKTQIRTVLELGKNLLLEGPVGVGKTTLALAVLREMGRSVVRIDGDSRYTEQKLTGWFDPPTLLKKGYTEESFVAGPLVEAMRTGAILFINELNRMPEGVQNLLLPALDERVINVPKLGPLEAHKDFCVIATQNPKDFVATSHLSEALLDRFEFVTMAYPPEEEETALVLERLGGGAPDRATAEFAVRLVRLTRTSPKVRRGASIRAAISIAEISKLLRKQGQEYGSACSAATFLALPTRIEWDPQVISSADRETWISAWITQALGGVSTPAGAAEKKSP